jgi:hypothetical protein
MNRDLRQYAQQTHLRLALGGLLLLFIVGDGLIWLFFGKEAAFMGFICLLLGLAPLVLIGLTLYLLEWIVKRHRPD